MTDRDETFRIRVLPRSRADGLLVHAHLEAHDHLAIATDLADGSVEIIGPASRSDEIAEVAREIATRLGALVVTART